MSHMTYAGRGPSVPNIFGTPYLRPYIKFDLTHSLVDLPRWGLATTDDHSDIFLLNCARFCDISFSWMYSQPVHSSMSCIHCLVGLPWCRDPSMIPSRTISANCPALPRVMWPKYCSFSFATLHINSLSRPNSINIESFVRCSCHEMLSIFFQHHISKCFYSVSVRFLQSPSLHSILEYCPHHWLHHFVAVCRSTSKSRPNNIRGGKMSVRPSVHKKFLRFEWNLVYR